MGNLVVVCLAWFFCVFDIHGIPPLAAANFLQPMPAMSQITPPIRGNQALIGIVVKELDDRLYSKQLYHARLSW